MGDKKNNNQRNTWAILLLCILSIIAIVFGIKYICSLHERETISLIITIISLIISIVSLVFTIFSFILTYNTDVKTNKKSNNVNQELLNKFRSWWYHNFKWFLIALAFVFVVSLGYKIIKDSVVDKRQRQFDDLVANYNKRMEQPLTFAKAYELLVEDSIMLVRIIQMLKEYPNLKVDTTDYSKQFENRAGEAIESLHYAIFVLESDSLKYTSQINRIEQMKNNLEQMKNNL